MDDIKEMIKRVQLEKALGELNVLSACYYNSMDNEDTESKKAIELIKSIIKELKFHLG